MKRTIALGGVILTAGLLGSALVTPAQADSVPTDVLAINADAAKQALKYWFGEKVSNFVNATPYNVETQVVATKLKSTVPAGSDGKAGVVPAIGDEKKAASTSKNINLPRTSGKVFFRGADGRPHWCTATSVQSSYHNLVATAGHCVYDTESNAATLKYWVFVPAYYQGKTPYGIFVGKQAFTHYDFDVYEDGDRDYAFVTVYNGIKWVFNTTTHKWGLVDTGRLGDAVGGQGLAYNQKIGGKVFVFGYPSGSHPDGNHAYSGKTLKWSYGATFKASASSINAQEIVGVKSSFTGEGSLGSSWLMSYKNGRRLGYLNGVTIGVSDTDGNNRYDTSVSPYFDGELFGVYSAAKNLWSGSIV